MFVDHLSILPCEESFGSFLALFRFCIHSRPKFFVRYMHCHYLLRGLGSRFQRQPSMDGHLSSSLRRGPSSRGRSSYPRPPHPRGPEHDVLCAPKRRGVSSSHWILRSFQSRATVSTAQEAPLPWRHQLVARPLHPRPCGRCAWAAPLPLPGCPPRAPSLSPSGRLRTGADAG